MAQLECTWRIRIAYNHKEIGKVKQSTENAKSAKLDQTQGTR